MTFQPTGPSVSRADLGDDFQDAAGDQERFGLGVARRHDLGADVGGQWAAPGLGVAAECADGSGHVGKREIGQVLDVESECGVFDLVAVVRGGAEQQQLRLLDLARGHKVPSITRCICDLTPWS